MSPTISRAYRAGAALAAAAALALLAACGTTPTAAGPHKPTSGPATVSATARAGAGQAAGGALTTITGATVRVPSSKPSVLAFISVGCSDCAAVTKAVAQAQRVAGNKATFLAVALDPGVPHQYVKGFLSYDDANNLPVTIDTKGTLTTKYQVSTLSSVLIVNPAGKVTYRAVNPSPAAITAALSAAS